MRRRQEAGGGLPHDLPPRGGERCDLLSAF